MSRTSTQYRIVWWYDNGEQGHTWANTPEMADMKADKMAEGDDIIMVSIEKTETTLVRMVKAPTINIRGNENETH